MQKKLFVVIEIFNIAVNDFDAERSVRCSWVLVVTELFNIVVNDSDVKKSAHYIRMLVAIEFVVT